MLSSPRIPLSFVLMIALAACTGGDSSKVERGPLGKADLAGTCVDSCGDQSPDGCWCDDLCQNYGDCCADKATVCDGAQEQVCGGLAGSICPDGQYCHFEEGDFCGAADATGVCQTPPEACIELFAPVCGCDGVTYSNWCFANAAGTSVASEGACEDPGTPGLCFTDDDCDSDAACDHSVCHSPPCPAGMACPAVCMGECVKATGQTCGGFAGLPCPSGFICEDDPGDDCDPMNGGADCGGICVTCPIPPCTLACGEFATDENGCMKCECVEDPPATCEGSCGGQAANGSCWCDGACSSYGDCCDDYAAECSQPERVPASGMCIKNSNDACVTDSDCTAGGCGGELCFNPSVSSGISTCECTAPTNVGGCGCVNGSCTWWN